MAFARSILAASCLGFLVVVSAVSTGRTGHGLIGYGINMYDPTCAYTCRNSISSSPLSCSMEDEGMEHMHHGDSPTPPECYATDDAFLSTLAWCMSTRCEDVPAWKLERYWKMNVAGRAAVQPDPKESYQESVAKVSEPPTETLVSGDPLNQTSLVSDEDYEMNFNALTAFERVEVTHERYGIVVLLSGVVIPIGLSLLRFIPWPAHLVTKFNAYFIYPPAFGSRHQSPILGIAHVPTRGQALFIAYLVAINVILCAAGINSRQPNAWAETTKGEILVYVSNRAGVLSFANVPLLILYAGRNNVLLWLTNWSHGTFLLLHRWVAWICTLQAILHSLIYLHQYSSSGDHASESKLAYWVWGAVGTIAMSVLLPTSTLPLRSKMYELFLAWHVVVSVFVVAACYLHIYHRFQRQWGYETWIFVAIAVWGFDRVMRLARLARNGVRTATVTVLDHDYVRVNVEGVSGNGHAYLYFPTATWRVWENHPFSIASATLPPRHDGHAATEKQRSTVDVEKHATRATSTSGQSDSIAADSHGSGQVLPTTIGLTFLLRLRSGLTRRIGSRTRLPVLVEASYGQHEDLSRYPLLIGIAGGVGITALVPLFRSHPGRTKLFWGTRSSAIVEDLHDTLAGVDKEIFVGKRMDVFHVLDHELADRSERAVIVVSGPSGMADEARMAVARLGRDKRKTSVRLVEESFSW